MRACLVMALLVSSSTAGGCAQDDCETGAELQVRLDGAARGDVITVGACRIAGPITVPAGVQLEGSGAATVIVAPANGRAVSLEPDGSGTSLRELSIESDGCAGVVAIGAGAVAIQNVEVRASQGVGLAVEGVDMLTLDNVIASGPVTPATADTTTPPLPPFGCGSSPLATHGIVLVDVASAALTAVQAEGFGAFGVLTVRSVLSWTHGGVATNLGAGVEIWGGEATLNELTFTGTREGTGAIEAYGGVFGGDARIVSRGLIVEDGDKFGLFHDGAVAMHEDLVARNNGFAAVWAQGVTSFELAGASTLEDNGFAAFAALESTGIHVRDASIERTTEGVLISGVRTIRGADGIHLVDSDGIFENLSLRDNDRVGVLVDLAGGTTSTVDLTNVTVDATGTALGAIAQNGTVQSGWDGGVTRLGDTPVNDASFTGTLEIAGAVGPVCLPPLDRLDTTGIGALIGP